MKVSRVLEVFEGESGDYSFTRVSSAIVLTTILVVFSYAAFRESWETVRSMADALMLLVFALFGVAKAPGIVTAATANSKPPAKADE